METAYDGRQVVGMDLHRRRSVLVRMTGDGRKLETVRIENSPAALQAVIARAGEHPRVVAGATYGWYWAVDVLEAAGWPNGIAQTVVIVGHQPTLGHVAAQLLGNSNASWPLKKAGVWWIASRERDGGEQAVLRAAISPDLV